MVKHVMEASHAIAEAAKAIKPGIVAAYPITPQTHIVERISDFVANGEMPNTEYIRVESEFSAISACLGASATGVRSYTSTSSQGLALMHEILFIVSGMRLPVCMSVVNRALSAPINIWNDQQDSISERDSGWLQFYVETAQEGHDLTLMQTKISENRDVLLPSMVCMDGFTLSHVYEPVDIFSQEDVNDFLPAYEPTHAVLDPDNPLTLGPIGFPSHYMELRYQQHKAMDESLNVIGDVYSEFNKKFQVRIPGSRPEEYWHVEEYRTDDAEIVLVAMGSVCGTIKVVIDRMREKGVKVGLLKIITYRPFPREVLKKALSKAGRIGIVEKAFGPGIGGVLVDEIKGLLYDAGEKPEIRSFIVGLGGKDVRLDHVEKIIKMMNEGKGKREEWMF